MKEKEIKYFITIGKKIGNKYIASEEMTFEQWENLIDNKLNIIIEQNRKFTWLEKLLGKEKKNAEELFNKQLEARKMKIQIIQLSIDVMKRVIDKDEKGKKIIK